MNTIGSDGPRQTPRLVCFDLGGVVIRICRSWQEGCARAGIAVRQSTDDRGASRAARNEVILAYQTGRIGGEEFSARISAVDGGLYSPQEIMAVHHAWMIDSYPGIADLIDELHGGGLETGVLSNTNHEHWLALHRIDAFTRLHHRHASHLLGLHKPDPAIYRAFEAAVGHTGDTIVFFDDLPENVESARAAGWRAERIDHSGDTAAQVRGHLVRMGALPPRRPARE